MAVHKWMHLSLTWHDVRMPPRGLGPIQLMILNELDDVAVDYEESWGLIAGMWLSKKRTGESARAFVARQRSERATVRRAARLLEKRGLVECRMQLMVDGFVPDEYEDDNPFDDPRERVQLAARITPAGSSYARAEPLLRSAASINAVPIATPRRRARRAARRGPAAF
jgi:DNA-binding transcriptional MocR family regulator